MRVIQNGATRTTTKKQYLLSEPSDGLLKAVQVMAANVAGTAIKEIAPGTAMAKVTSGANAGLYRPAASAGVNGDQAAVTLILLEDGQAENFFIGDIVEILSTAGRRGTATLTDLTAANDDIDLEGAIIGSLAHVVQLVDPGALRLTTDLTSLTWAGTPGESVGTFVFTLSSTVAPTIDATVNDLIDAINRDAGHWLRATLAAGSTGTNVIDDAAVTGTLSGGIAVGGIVDATETLSAVDKTLHKITVGNAQTLIDGDQIRVINAPTAEGILVHAHNSVFDVRDSAGDSVRGDKGAQIYVSNIRVTEAQVAGVSTFIKTDLQSNGKSIIFE